MKHVYLFESVDQLGKKDLALLDRILNHSENFLKFLKDTKNEDDLSRFAKHFKIEKFIKAEPDKMAGLLVKAVESDKKFQKWISHNSENFPESFKKSVGLYSDLKNLGF